MIKITIFADLQDLKARVINVQFLGLLAAVFMTCSALTTTAFGAGTISGKVTISDMHGNQIKDHSNVVVFIDGLNIGPVPPANDEMPRISHLGKSFTPRVLPILKGGEINFLNDDDIFHNVFSLSKAKTFDLGVYPVGTSKYVTFEKTGLVKLYCNIHPNMVSNILVLSNSLYFTTHDDGRYEITDVPTGTFTLRAWHELGESAPLQVSIAGSSEVTQNISIKLTRKLLQHKNKFGKTYKEKY